MILGNICTRNCKFCAVEGGIPLKVDESEPKRVAEAAKKLGLKYVVVTSVTRDDLPDGGANQFAETIKEVRGVRCEVRIEVLIPDFQGSKDPLFTVIAANPDVINHNVETVPRLYPSVRPQANYQTSLNLLKTAKEINQNICTKSGLMVGLGESFEEATEVLKDLRSVNCDIVTIGQYLPPSQKHVPVVQYVEPAIFEKYRDFAINLGFRSVASGPFVRSSYHAELMQ